MPKAIEDQAFRRLPNLQLPLDLPIKDKTLKATNASHVGKTMYSHYIDLFISHDLLGS